MPTRNRTPLLVLVIGLFVTNLAFSAEPAGKLVSMTGQVVATAQGTAPRQLHAGDPVMPGDSLKSDATSSAKFLMNDQTILDLNPSSELMVEHFELRSGSDRQVEISVMSGTLRASVNKPLMGAGKFHIKTKSAIMGVRGTEFVVENSDRAGQSQLTVMKGLVQVAPTAPGAAEIGVSPGNQLSMASGMVPKLVQLSPDQLSMIAKSATVRDVTFGSAVEIRRSTARTGSAATASVLS
ncbi:MAG: FecR family protein, partial [Bdellovibrionota bacterium]